MKKIIKTAVLTAVASTMLFSTTAYAREWLKISDDVWMCQGDDGMIDFDERWEWIDGNKDGIAECYYFQPGGVLLPFSGTTPDGYTVNADGAWTVDGVVQTKPIADITNKITYINRNQQQPIETKFTESGQAQFDKYIGDEEFEAMKTELLEQMEDAVQKGKFSPNNSESKELKLVYLGKRFDSDNEAETEILKDKARSVGLHLWSYINTVYIWEVERMDTVVYELKESNDPNDSYIGVKIKLQ